MLLGHAGVEWLKGMCLHVGTATVPAAPGISAKPLFVCCSAWARAQNALSHLPLLCDFPLLGYLTCQGSWQHQGC